LYIVIISGGKSLLIHPGLVLKAREDSYLPPQYFFHATLFIYKAEFSGSEHSGINVKKLNASFST